MRIPILYLLQSAFHDEEDSTIFNAVQPDKDKNPYQYSLSVQERRDQSYKTRRRSLLPALSLTFVCLLSCNNNDALINVMGFLYSTSNQLLCHCTPMSLSEHSLS